MADSYVLRTGGYTFTVSLDHQERWTYTVTVHRGAAGLIDTHHETVMGGVTSKAQALAHGSRMMIGDLADSADEGLDAWLRR